MPTQEEILLDELLDATKAGSIDQTIKVFPDPSRLDPNKTTGRGLRALFAATITRLKEWVKAELLGKANATHGHTISEVDNLQTTLNGHNQRITDNTNALEGKADLVGGKVPASQLPELVSGSVLATVSDFTPELAFASVVGNYNRLHEQTANIELTKAADSKAGACEHVLLQASGSHSLLLPADTVVAPEEFTLTNGVFTATLAAGTYSLYLLHRAQDSKIEVSMRLNAIEAAPLVAAPANITAYASNYNELTVTWQ